MSFASQTWTLERIESAEPYSPIAVFICDANGKTRKSLFDAIFASTYIGQNRIKAGVGLIGVYDKRDWVQARDDIKRGK